MESHREEEPPTAAGDIIIRNYSRFRLVMNNRNFDYSRQLAKSNRFLRISTIRWNTERTFFEFEFD